MVIYPSKIFVGSIRETERGAYAVHCCDGSWKEKSLFKKIKEKHNIH
jgi:hypothetical protein